VEKLDIYDINGNKLNKICIRGEGKLLDNEYFLVTTIWIKSGIRYLIQLTSEQKGSVYAVTGGHVTSGRTSLEQIKTECKEELNFDLDDSKLKFMGKVYFNKMICDTYFYEDDEQDLETINFQLQKEEVEDVLWLTKDEIEDMILKNIFRESSAMQYMKFIRNL